VSRRLISQLLGYAGLIPFFGFCLGFSSLEDWPRSLSIQGFVIYSLAIFAFLAGALWGQVQAVTTATGQSAVSTLIVSNGLVLFGVAAILTAQAMMAAVFLMLGYIALLWYETRVSRLEAWYGLMRRRLTLGVVFAHIIFVVLHITGA
jgi:hypothetical protein